MKKKCVKLIVFLMVFSQFLNIQGRIKKETLELKELVLIDSKYLYKIPSGLRVKGNILYVLDNVRSVLYSYTINHDTLKYNISIGKFGQGPGDLISPFLIFFSDKQIVIQDSNAISFFSYSGAFQSKFRIFGMIHDMTLNKNMIYTLNPDFKSQKLIHRFGKDGKKINSFGSFFVKIKKDNRKNTFWIYKGFLRNDGNDLLYFSKLYGQVIRFNSKGEKKGEKSYLQFIGSNRKRLLNINKELLETGTEKKKSRSFFTGLNILGNIVVGEKNIYLLSLEEYYPNDYLINRKKYVPPLKETLIIKVIDKEKWKLVKEYKVQADKFYYSTFDVQEIKGKAKFFFCFSNINGNSYGYAGETD